MDFTFVATVIGFIVSVITLGIWALALYRKLLSQIDDARRDADEGKRIAEGLVSSATNAEKRADIYLYVTLHALEFGLRRTKSTTSNATFGIIFFILFLSFLWMAKVLDVDYKHPLIILFYITASLSLVAWGTAIWHESILRKLEDGWQVGVKNALSLRISKHGTKA